MTKTLVTIRTWGDFACFTRPEMKVERVSYPVMTPSAARGILEAIFWEPQMCYLIDSIRIVQRGRWISLRRNEVTARISLAAAQKWIKSPDTFRPIQAGGGADDGTQRNMLALETVEYIITAEVRLTDQAQPGRDSLPKYRAEIERRARSGKCYHRPALGMRELVADFEWEDDAQAALERRAGELNQNWHTIWPSEDLGLMLYDVFDVDERLKGFRWRDEAERAPVPVRSKPSPKDLINRWSGVKTVPQAMWFQAQIHNARLDCHPEQVNLLKMPGR